MSIKQYLKRGARFILKGVPVKNIRAEITYSQPDARLKGKKIIITGGGRGLGAAMAEKFVKEGAEVLISGRNEDVLKQTAERLNCKYLTLDISNPDNFSRFISDADKMLDGFNVLVNNAGISLHEKTFFDVTSQTFDAQINTNFKGAFFLTQEFVKRMIEKKQKADILFVSSETGDTMDFRPYGFTKAAVNSMVQGLAYLFAKDGIRVNAVAPGITATDMTGYSQEGNLYLESNATERVYLPLEVAETACFLLSDISSCISGQILVCNNARTINARWK